MYVQNTAPGLEWDSKRPGLEDVLEAQDTASVAVRLTPYDGHVIQEQEAVG
jgi:hypothetical protein